MSNAEKFVSSDADLFQMCTKFGINMDWLAGKFERFAARGGNYTADDEVFPQSVTFANGRKVAIAFLETMPYLQVEPANAATMTETPRCNVDNAISRLAPFPGGTPYVISTEPPCTMDSDCECSCCKKVFAAQRGATR